MADTLPSLITLTTPLGNDALRFSTMTATEEMGRLFDFNLIALSEQNDIDPKALLGKRVTVSLELSDHTLRHFNGIVTRAGQGGGRGRLHAYELSLRPWLWMLSRRADTRIFQGKSVPDILKEVFQPYSTDFQIQLQDSYAPLEYCVQYRETDFNFASRLMEQEGIYYFFRHTADQHMLVLADKASVHVPVEGHAQFRYRPQSLGAIEYEAINEWHFSQEIQPGKVSLTDYDFVQPSTSLKVDAQQDRGFPGSSYEYYDQPGDYLTTGEGSRYAQLRIEELQARYAMAGGYGTMSALTTGFRFTLTDHPRKDQNREHIVVSTRINLRHAGYESGSDDAASYTCQFTALDSREVFRPQRVTPKPVVPGPQTAIVVGPAGDEIHTDQHGRIKVQFHWDRLGKKDANSSCWMRVVHPGAGKGWGVLSLPRIGHEVVVEFLEGDPDRPIVTGSVFNGENLTPYVLPDNATVSTLKSRSSKGGAASNFNELRFEDRKGAEYVWFQAEKNHFHLVKNDVVQTVGRDEIVTIARDRREKINGAHNIHVVKDVVQAVSGSMHLGVGSDVLLRLGGEHGLHAGEDISAEAGRAISQRAGTNINVKANKSIAIEAGTNLHLKAGMNLVIEAGTTLTLKAGDSNIVIGPSGVSITGSMVLINSGGSPGDGPGAKPVAPTAPGSMDEITGVKDPLPSR